MELTQVDRDILTALISIYRRESRVVKAEEIAKLIDRNPGTVRNRMHSLEALNLVKGMQGLKGDTRLRALLMRLSISMEPMTRLLCPLPGTELRSTEPPPAR